MPPLRVRSPRKPADGGCSYGTRGTVQTGRNPRRFFDRSIAGADRTCRMAAFCPADRAARQHGPITAGATRAVAWTILAGATRVPDEHRTFASIDIAFCGRNRDARGRHAAPAGNA